MEEVGPDARGGSEGRVGSAGGASARWCGKPRYSDRNKMNNLFTQTQMGGFRPNALYFKGRMFPRAL